MTRQLLCVGLFVGMCAPPFAQTPPQRPSFEVASIKPYDKEPYYSFSFPPDGSFKATLPLEWLIGMAWDIRPFDRIIGEPGWARTEYFEIEAKPTTRGTRADTLAMLRTLIEDRFGLVWRLDTNRTAEVYALTMAQEDGRLGPAIRPSQCNKDVTDLPPVAERQLRSGAAVPCGTANNDRVFAGGGVPIGVVASAIQLAVGEEVVERTNLTGTFDYYVTLPRSQNPDQQDSVSIFTAIEEQFGMKLRREEVPRGVFIVEKASRPTPN